jgi:hypothetical protein
MSFLAMKKLFIKYILAVKQVIWFGPFGLAHYIPEYLVWSLCSLQMTSTHCHVFGHEALYKDGQSHGRHFEIMKPYTRTVKVVGAISKL